MFILTLLVKGTSSSTGKRDAAEKLGAEEAIQSLITNSGKRRYKSPRSQLRFAISRSISQGSS